MDAIVAFAIERKKSQSNNLKVGNHERGSKLKINKNDQE